MLKSINKTESQHYLHLINVLTFNFRFKSLKLSNNVVYDSDIIKT